MKTLTLALDWTPNINHIGFFIARRNGFYRDIGLDVSILDPADDDYFVTPAKKVESGQADTALCPTESIISYRTKPEPFDLTGIAAVFQEDLSAVAVRADGGIETPRDLDGRSYASYRARYEDEIVRQLIRSDGGKGGIEVVYPEKLGIWETLISGRYDSSWIFTNWEGVEAESRGAALNLFRMRDYGIPYSYSPVIAASKKSITHDRQVYIDFLIASKQGYMYARKHPEEAVSLLEPFIPEKDAHIDLKRALALSAEAFGDDKSWGRMDEHVVDRFLEWLKAGGLEPEAPASSELITNELINET